MATEENTDEHYTKQTPLKQSKCSHCNSYRMSNGPFAFYGKIEHQISLNVRLSEVTTRPVKHNGLWCGMLLPLVLTTCKLLHNVSPVYTLATFQSYALLIYSLLFLLFLYMTPAILTENRSTGYMVSTLFSCILIYWQLQLNITHTFIFSTLAVYPYLFLLRKVLKLCPNTFTIGEAMIVVQGIILFMNHIIGSWYYGVYEYNQNDDKEMTFVKTTVATVLSTMGLIVTAMYLMRYKTVGRPGRPNSSQQILPMSVLVAGVLFALVILHYQLGKTYIADFIYYIFIDNVRLKLIGGWFILVLLTVGIITRRTQFGEKGNSGSRKPLHILASGVFLTGILADLKFLSLAAGLILGLIVFLEAIRVNKLGSIAEGLQAAYDVYSDEKDSGVLAMTPIYLYVGLACPLLIVPWRPDCELELLSGVLSIGVGDSAASYFGENYGTNKWPNSNRTKEGSIANVISQVLVVYLLRNCGLLVSPFSVTRTIFAATISALFESQLEQVDNLILPLIMVLCYEITFPLTRLV